jgi:hypothetical protein
MERVDMNLEATTKSTSLALGPNLRLVAASTAGISRDMGERRPDRLEGQRGQGNGGNQQGGGDQNGTQQSGLFHQSGTPLAQSGIPRHVGAGSPNLGVADGVAFVDNPGG